ncbi:hypothetical protein SEA_BOOSTSEASON_34 [Mycobacterium phage BoostSeason]|uniref:Uncharacterized protein n=1 Tax=Mycobacterium phage Mufasa TaxID=1718600 RepID=A0A0M4QU82_9CAUD|nr:hypothetical protein SEA_MUFASA_34 [Mycobacterium phage Mufasa]ALF00468.1 hypothetical protein SEA_MUFASA_34 [Mycobacterium phage Mufasa]AYN57207.1 hypothetical protein SEA_BOOSTSEASON_34 [Mycobacterium phage BoostSeason]
MSLAARLGPLTRAPIGCAVCRWYEGLDEGDRATFDSWVNGGGSISQLWRECCADPDRPLHISRPRFSECINQHHRGGPRVAS